MLKQSLYSAATPDVAIAEMLARWLLKKISTSHKADTSGADVREKKKKKNAHAHT